MSEKKQFNFVVNTIGNAYLLKETGEEDSYFQTANALSRHIRMRVNPDDVKTRVRKGGTSNVEVGAEELATL